MLANMRRNRIFLAIFCIIAPMGFLVLKQQQRSAMSMDNETKLNNMTPMLLQKVEELKKKLDDVEFLSHVRSQEIVSLRRELAKVLPANETATSLNLPSIYGLLPHLNSQPDGLTPVLQVSQGRKGVTLAFGIPSVGRVLRSYLVETIESMLHGLTEDDKNDVVIIIFIGDKSPEKVAERSKEIQEKFADAIKVGVLEIIAPPASFYPDMTSLPLTFGDPLDRVQWRTKQNLDYAFLMMYAQNKARFYIQMEDDVVASPSYASVIKAFAMQQDIPDWFVLEFSALGFIGKLFRSSELGMLVDFFLMFHKDKPIDWLLDHILWVKVCNPEKDGKHCHGEKSKLRIKFKPSLFQHVGKESSLRGKKQSLIDKDFKQQPLFQAHLNPRALVKSTFETYQGYTPEKAYLGQGFFWGLTPHAGEVLRFCFKYPVNIERFKFRTGNMEHPGDTLRNATVEILTDNAKRKSDEEKANDGDFTEMSNEIGEQKESQIKNEYEQKDYLIVGKFGESGTAEGKLLKDIGRAAEIRIRVVDHKKENWVVLSEIHIVERKNR